MTNETLSIAQAHYELSRMPRTSCTCDNRIHRSQQGCIHYMHYLHPPKNNTLQKRINEVLGTEMYLNQGTCRCENKDINCV